MPHGNRGYTKPVPWGATSRKALRDRILHERGLQAISTIELAAMAPKTPLRSALASLVASYYKQDIETVLRTTPFKRITFDTGVTRVTLWRWCKQLNIKRRKQVAA